MYFLALENISNLTYLAYYYCYCYTIDLYRENFIYRLANLKAYITYYIPTNIKEDC